MYAESVDLDETLRKLNDSLTVMEAFQRRHAEALKDHEEWLQTHDRAMLKHAQAMADADEKINILIRTQQEVIVAQRETEKSLKAFLDSLRKGGNGDQTKA